MYMMLFETRFSLVPAPSLLRLTSKLVPDDRGFSANAALSASVSSGIRSFFCYTPTKRLRTWNPLVADSELLPEWVESHLKELAKEQPFGDGRVQLGFGFDGFFLPKETVVDLFTRVRGMGIKLITVHYTNNGAFGPPASLPSLLADYKLLGPDILLSHANGPWPEDTDVLNKHGGYLSSTPDTELQMGLGAPICYSPELFRRSSLGVDCHSACGGGVLAAMRMSLQAARGMSNQKYIEAGKLPSRINATVEDAFNLATILGARTIGMEHKIGSLDVGKLADVTVFSGTSPATICAADHDPLAAIVLHSSVRDVEVVIVDGVVRKDTLSDQDPGAGGTGLAPSVVDAQVGGLLTGEETVHVGWKAVIEEVRESRRRIQKALANVDISEVKEFVIKGFGVDREIIVDQEP